MQSRTVWAALIIVMMASATAALSARATLDQARQLDDGARHWDDRTQTLQLHSTDAAGNQKYREVRMLTKRGSGDERQTVAFIAAPPEVRGVAFLQVEHAGRDTEQWLYLPEFRRTRQISTRLRNESFVGTDLSYRDLEIISRFLQWTEAEVPSRLIGEDSTDGLACQRIELKPQLNEPSYSLIVVWLDNEKLVPRRMDLIGSNGQVAKQIRFADMRDVGRVPTAHRIEVKNMVKGSQTIVEVQHVEYDQNLADELFTQRQLERGAP